MNGNKINDLKKRIKKSTMSFNGGFCECENYLEIELDHENDGNLALRVLNDRFVLHVPSDSEYHSGDLDLFNLCKVIKTQFPELWTELMNIGENEK